ncbi:MAG: carbohydrate ABC transporter permease [Treponema sp.]|jgi:multiple sugar transport system permease protein|nr:carbohydrate ABC transporter permease [Treponema sp.]
MQKKASKFSVYQLVLHGALAAILVLMLYPLVMSFWNAFKNELGFIYSRWYPTIPLRYRNFVVAFPKIWRYIYNTLTVALFGIIGLLFVSSLGAYTFARMKFPGKEFIYMAVIALMMIPDILTLVPRFMLYKGFGMLNTPLVLIIPVITGGSVFGTFLLRAFFGGVPEDIFEAARIDGANEFRVYYSICLPLCIPILGTLTIMQISNIWNDYLWPMITQQYHKNLTISAGLVVEFVNEYTSNYPVQFAGYLLSSLPLILLFIFANKYYIEGLTSSAIKF